MIDTINEFTNTVSEIFTLIQNVLPREIKVIIYPIFTILLAVLIYKIIRKVKI